MPKIYYSEQEVQEMQDELEALRHENWSFKQKNEQQHYEHVYTYLKNLVLDLRAQNAVKWRKKIEQDYLEALNKVRTGSGKVIAQGEWKPK